MTKKPSFAKWLLRPAGIVTSVWAALISTSATSTNAAVDGSDPMGTIEELAALILSPAPEADVLEAFCRLQDLSEERAYSVAGEYTNSISSDNDGETVSVSFASCDLSGSARLVVI